MNNPQRLASQYLHPEAIVSTASLESQLSDPDLRIFDCTVYLVAPDEKSPYEVVSGRDDYLKAHIPGAAFLDLQQDLSAQESSFRFTMPALDDLAERFARAGVDRSTRVVLYTRGNLQWSTRVWWMLRAVGFDQAAILDGGWERWEAENRPAESAESHYPAGHFTPQPRPGLFTDRHGVLSAMGKRDFRVLNALSPQLHAGESARYGRAGRIPGSVNVPAASLRQPDTGLLVDAASAARMFESAGIGLENPTVIYCGGGIAATLDAFMLYQLGAESLSVYDHSLNEWCADPSLPMETDSIA